MRTYRGVLPTLVLALLLAGCASTRQADQVSAAGTAWPLDSLAYLYADPIAVSPINDHPFRWVGFALHPVGVALDRVVNRPLYSFASGSPIVFGFTPEDATLHAQRPSGSYR